MKKWTVVALMAIVVGLFWSCSDDSSTGPENQYLEVNIISPIDSSEFNDGENVTIEVEASTNVGSIKEVILVIDRFTRCEKFIDTNNNGRFDREEFIDNNANSNWDQGEVFIDANFNNQYDGDFLYDSNENNRWDFWEIDQDFTGFNDDVYLDKYMTDSNNNNIVGDTELFLTDSISPYIFDLQAKFRYLDGDILHDTGEPFIDQKRFQIVNEQLVEFVNGYWDEGTEYTLTLKTQTDDYISTYHGGSTEFWERIDYIQTSQFYNTGVTFNADSSEVTLNYDREYFADLRSSMGIIEQPTPRFNDVYDSVENGIQDEFEAYCSIRSYGSYGVSENILGWTEGHSPFDNPSDYVEFIGSYVIYRAPVAMFQGVPNISDLTFDLYSTWIDTNENGLYDAPNSTYDLEEFIDYNYNGNFEAPNPTYDLDERYLTGSSIEAIAIDSYGNSVEHNIVINIKP